ncbi:LacI family DNA-binding transcriptional regulator [Martelella sp. HB161492]|uniref:LacI family DNA-binding transcriptional regulator n=1 Tax=Martelella sp. HB161492 TaxID=2720726 RepID=UPI0015913BEE|nr:LacI family DNA-binding transcriptional regulator [Martelella sp. HB161492]
MTDRGQKRAKRITQSDVAAMAGVSTAVVSAVISPKPGKTIRVGEEAAKRVRAAMETLGYAPDVVAQSLARGQRNIIGVFTYEAVFPSDRKNFFYPFLLGIERGAMRCGQDLLLFTSSTLDKGRRSIFPNGTNRMGIADGAILLGAVQDKAELKRLCDTGFPFVTIGRREVGGRAVSWVAPDYCSAVRDVVARCRALGHRTLKFIGESEIREQNEDRERGFLENGFDDLSLSVERIDPDKITQAWVRMLLRSDATVVLTETFAHAVALERQISALGLDIPDVISVVALAAPLFDEAEGSRWTRISIPREEMGERAVENLILKIRDPANAPDNVMQKLGYVPGETLKAV